MIIGGNNGTYPILNYEYFDIEKSQWAKLQVELKIPPIAMYNINGFLIKRFDEDGCDAIVFSLALLRSYICR